MHWRPFSFFRHIGWPDSKRSTLKNHFGLFVMKYGQILRTTVSKVFLMIIFHIIFIHCDRYIGGHFVVSAILVSLESCIKYQKSCFEFYVQSAIKIFRVFNRNIFLIIIFWDFSAFLKIIFLFFAGIFTVLFLLLRCFSAILAVKYSFAKDCTVQS